MVQEGHSSDTGTYTVTLTLDKIGIYAYCFSYCKDGKTFFIKRKIHSMEGFITPQSGYHWELTCYQPTFEMHPALAGSTFYEIFPDRFYRSPSYVAHPIPGTILRDDWGNLPTYLPTVSSTGKLEVKNNDFFGGNLAGIMEKLPYLKELGVKILYLMPIWESKENHGYATANYLNVSPYLGSSDDLKKLCTKAHELGMYVMLDGVFNHTGSNSLYFNKEGEYPSLGAYQSPQSSYYSWYHFTNYPDKYTCWWDFPTLPKLNVRVPSLQEFILGKNGIIETWFSYGIDGIRLDVVDELPDEFLTLLCKKIHSLGGFVMGEVWENAATKVAYNHLRSYFLGYQLDGVMNYPFKDAILEYVKGGNAEKFFYDIMEIVESYPKPALASSMNFLSTHDTVRALTYVVGKNIDNMEWVERRKYAASIDKLSPEAYEQAKEYVKLAWTFLCFVPGNPCIFYGDEIGLHGYADPFNRKCFPWNDMDCDLLSFYQELGEIRNSISCFLAKANFRFLHIDKSICVYERVLGNQKIIVGINRTNDTQKFTLHNLCKLRYVRNCEVLGHEVTFWRMGCFVLECEG